MFCPKCGKSLPDSAAFCDACGTALNQPSSEGVSTVPPDAPVPAEGVLPMPKRKSPVKPILIAIAAIVVVGAGIWGISRIGSAGGGKNAYAYFSDGSFGLVTSLKDKSTLTMSSLRSENSASYDMLQFSPDGKYVYFYTKYDSMEGTGTLSRAEYGKMKNGGNNEQYIETVASNVAEFKVLDSGTLLYMNGDDTLYSYSGSDPVQIAKRVDSYYVTDDERIVYESEDALYGADLKNSANSGKLASGLDWVVSYADSENILFMRDHALYSTGFGRESEKISDKVDIISYGEKIIYMVMNEDGLSLYDYFTDDNAAADANIKKPDISNYTIPNYRYVQLTTNSDPNSYDEIYISCSALEAELDKMSDYINRLADGSELKEFYNTKMRGFINKYKSQENGDGYAVVTEAIRSDLIDMYGDGEWLKVCFCHQQDGTTYDYDAYNTDNAVYENAADRIALREQIQDSSLPTYSVYSYEKIGPVLLNDRVVNYDIAGDAFIFNTPEMMTERPDLNKAGYSKVRQLFQLDKEAQNYIISLTDATVYQLSSQTAMYYADAADPSFYFVGNGVYLDDMGASENEIGELYYTVPKNGLIDNMTTVTTEGTVIHCADDQIYYINNYDKTSRGDFYFDVYSCRNGESTRLSNTCMPMSVYEDGTMLVFTDYSVADNTVDISVISPNGSSIALGEFHKGLLNQMIHRVDKSTYLYVQDEILYRHNGKERMQIKSDVNTVWCLDEMTAVTPDYLN